MLEGEAGFLEAKDGEKSVSYNLVEKGLGIKPKAGRIDSAWGEASEQKKPVKKAEENKTEKTSSLNSPASSVAN